MNFCHCIQFQGFFCVSKFIVEMFFILLWEGVFQLSLNEQGEFLCTESE